MKKIIQLGDRIPLWLRTAAVEQEYANVRNEEMASIPDPDASGEVLRPVVAYLYINEKSSDTETQSDHVVGLYWKEMGGESDIFSKSYKEADDAREAYDELKNELNKLQAQAKVDFDAAKKLTKTFLDEKQTTSNTNTDVATPGSGSKTMSTLTNGWTIVASDEKPHVYFGFEFLEKALQKFDTVTDLPAEKPDVVYQTLSKAHCGIDNYVVSYWKKTLTKEGNIIRNVVEIYRSSPIEEMRLVRKNASLNDFDVICNSLTPQAADYGISFDRGTDKWVKTAGLAIREVFFNTVEEMLKWQEKQNLGESTKGKTEKLPEPQEGKDSPVKEKVPSSISLDELDEELPEKVKPEEIGSPSESLEKIPEATAPFAKSSLTVDAKLNPADVNEGDAIIYRTDDGKTIRGTVAKKYTDNGKIQFDLANKAGETFIHKCEEELSSEGDLVSYFMKPSEYAAEKAREITHNVQKSKEVLNPLEVIPPSEVLEERVKPSVGEGEGEEIAIAPEESEDDPEEGAPTTEEVEVETSLRPLSYVEVTSSLKQWIDWPNGLPNEWMKEVYTKLNAPFRVGPSPDPNFPGLKVEVQALEEKKLKSDEIYKKFAEEKAEIAKKMRQIGQEILSLDEEISKAEVAKNNRAVTELVEKKKGFQDKLENIQQEFHRARKEYRRAYVDPDGYKQALIQMFYKYAPMSPAKLQLSIKEDPAAVASVSKKLREVMNKEKEQTAKINELRKQVTSLAEQMENKEDALWTMFKELPGYEYVTAVQQRINHIDSYFSDFLIRNPSPSDEMVTKFQDTIAKLEKERDDAFEKTKLLPEHQAKADALIKEIHDLRENIIKGPHHKEFAELQKELEKIEQEKNKLQDEIGVIAAAAIYLEVTGEKK